MRLVLEPTDQKEVKSCVNLFMSFFHDNIDHSDFTSMATIAAKVRNNHHITKRNNIFMRDFSV